MTNNLYLINCNIKESYYMNGSKISELNHIVEAETEKEAIEKIEKFYNAKTSEYSVYYDVNINYCNELIR